MTHRVSCKWQCSGLGHVAVKSYEHDHLNITRHLGYTWDAHLDYNMGNGHDHQHARRNKTHTSSANAV